jgi:hypothetical protein
MVAPPSRFSKSALTGTRLPLKSHAPLTLSARRSTAEHWLQSSMTRSYTFADFMSKTARYLPADSFAGYADFLVRHDGPSKLGAHHYEVRDTKLARSTPKCSARLPRESPGIRLDGSRAGTARIVEIDKGFPLEPGLPARHGSAEYDAGGIRSKLVGRERSRRRFRDAAVTAMQAPFEGGSLRRAHFAGKVVAIRCFNAISKESSRPTPDQHLRATAYG